MTIIFELNCRDNLERSLIPEFCSNIIESMRHDITSKISRNKLQAHEKDILNSEVIRWGIKPRSLNMSDLLATLAKNIVISNDKDIYTIRFSYKNLYNTTNSIASVARLLDKGNEKFRGIYIIGNIFNLYRSHMNDFWELFITQKLNRVTTSEILVIK